jgi:hypothetical protein
VTLQQLAAAVHPWVSLLSDRLFWTCLPLLTPRPFTVVTMRQHQPLTAHADTTYSWDVGLSALRCKTGSKDVEESANRALDISTDNGQRTVSHVELCTREGQRRCYHAVRLLSCLLGLLGQPRDHLVMNKSSRSACTTSITVAGFALQAHEQTHR